VTEQLGTDWAQLIVERARGAQMWRMPGWTARVGLVLEGVPWLIAQPLSSHLDVQRWMPGGPAPTTTVCVTLDGLRRWLTEGVDFTHLVKEGLMQVVGGTYFDLLLLSKALRLRPEISQPGAS
jgi:hypothetical protein